MSELMALQLQQQVSVAAGEAAEEPGEFTQFMRAAYYRHSDLKAALAKEQALHQETKRLFHIAQEEIGRLTKELADLRMGKGVVIAIDGHSFSLSVDALPMEAPMPMPPSPGWSMNADWLTDGPQHDTPKLTDSFILSKD